MIGTGRSSGKLGERVVTQSCGRPAPLHCSVHVGITQGRVICVFGESHEAVISARCRRGRVAERYADLSIITSDDPYERRPLQAAHDLLDGFHQPSKAHVLPNRTKAIEWALNQAQPGDVNRDRRLDISDPVGMLRFLFQSREIACEAAMEVNGDEKQDLSDPIYLLRYLFDAGPPPPSLPRDCS